MIEPAVATAGTSRVVPVLEWILNRPEPLGAPLLAQVDRELAALVASEPHPSEFLINEPTNTAVYTALPMLFGPKWSPPGKIIGKPEDEIPFDPPNARLLLSTLHKHRLAYGAACTPNDAPTACVSRMESLSDELGGEYTTDRENPSRWLDWLLDPASARPNGETPLLVIVVGLTAFKNYVIKHGQTRFYLGALRLLARYRALAEETTSCPSIAVFDSPAFADARIDPYSGKKLRIERVGAGRFVVKSSEELELGDEPEDAIAIHVRCPFLVQEKPPADGGI